MRHEFVQALIAAAQGDDRVVLLTGDLGYMALEPFAERFPDRFFNIGVAEQNMLGLATGLAEAGFVPFAYSIATFASMRPYEFFRNGAILHELPVRLVGMGGGLDYGANGVTHFALEDLALMRAQPGLTVVVPAEAMQVEPAVRAALAIEGPLYLRLERMGAPVPGLNGRFELGRVDVVRAGTDVVFVAAGGVALEASAAAERLDARGVSAGLAVVSTLAPAPTDELVRVLGGARVAVAVESHYVNGGLGSLLAEVIAEHGLGTRLVRCGIDETPRNESGGRDFLHARYGISAEALEETAAGALASNG